jgi:adenylate cyclase
MTPSALGLEVLRAAPSSVVVMDITGRITMLNGAAERLFSVQAAEAEGKLYPEVFGPSLANRIVSLFLRATRPGAAGAAHAVTATLPSGRRATLRANAGPLHDNAGAVVGVFFVADEQVDTREAGEEKEARLRQALQRYVGDNIASRIADHPSFVGVGGTRQVVSVLHADVRGYTTLAEALEPEEVSRLLIKYHGKAVSALGSEQATIDRYIGDAILALWNAPAPQETHARLAIKGALAMRQVTQALGRDLEYGIGLHTGEAVVGNLGSAEYMHYTAIGDTVNVAARLQSAAPAGGIVCSAATLDAAGDGVRVTPLGDLAVKGRKGTVRAFAVEGIEE